jgi:hypothetical protein
MNSYCSDFSEKNVRPHVRDFYNKILSVVEGGQLVDKVNVGDLRALIYGQLEDLVIPYEELEFEGLVGSGSTSKVYKGCFRFCDVAFKQINISLCSGKQLTYLFNELTCMKKLRHPNVVLLLGISIDDMENLIIILEYFEQLTMDQFVKKYKGQIPISTKCEILFDIGKFLTFNNL